jgi:steroid delta-isomerase-like uncharacterized protein
MAVTFSIELTGDESVGAKLEEIRQRLGIKGDEDVAPGMLAHLESRTATGYRIVDVWESEADFERFFQERLGKAFEDSGFSPLQGPPTAESVTNLVQRQRVASHESTVRALYDAFTRNDPTVFDRHLHDDFIEHEEMEGLPTTREGVKQLMGVLHTAFADFRMTPVEVISAPGRAAARIRVTGRHVGEFMGIPATGRGIDIEAIDCFVIDSDGLVREHWGLIDQGALMVQLGIPAQVGAPAATQPRETTT